MPKISRRQVVEILDSLKFQEQLPPEEGEYPFFKKPTEATQRVDVPEEDEISELAAFTILCDAGLTHKEAKARLGIPTYLWIP